MGACLAFLKPAALAAEKAAIKELRDEMLPGVSLHGLKVRSPTITPSRLLRVNGVGYQ